MKFKTDEGEECQGQDPDQYDEVSCLLDPCEPESPRCFSLPPQWSSWSECVADNCSENGTRTRSLETPEDCQIDASELTEERCEVALSEWSAWSDCDPGSCERTRNRTADNRLCYETETCVEEKLEGNGTTCEPTKSNFTRLTPHPEDKQDKDDGDSGSAAAPVVIVLLIVLLAGLAAFAFRFRSKIKDFYFTSAVETRPGPGGGRISVPASNNNTTVLTKDNALKTSILSALDREHDLVAEFRRVERRAMRPGGIFCRKTGRK